MMRGPASFKKSDVTRLLMAVAAAGVQVLRVEIDKQGKIALVIGGVKETAQSGNEWDEALAK